MIIATYGSKHPELPPDRRWLAQIEKIKGRMYVCFHGGTEEEALSKAQAFWDKMPKKDAPIEASPVPEQHEPEKRARNMDDLL